MSDVLIIKNIIFSVLSSAVRNPVVQKKSASIARNILETSKPKLLKASRKAGKITADISKEITKGIKNFNSEKK